MIERHARPMAALCAIALACAACAPNSPYFGNVDPPRENVFRFNLGPEPEFLDPALMTGLYDARLAVLLFEGLTAKDPESLQPRPGVAASWEVSPDGRTYVFHLRPEAVWTDGTPVTAADFVYAWTRVLDPATGARNAYYLYCIVNARAFNEGKLKDASQLGVRAIDAHTLEVRLNQPVPYFLLLTNFDTYYPVPRAAIEKYGMHWTEPGHIVSNGPFRLLEHRIHDRLILERNPSYWNRGEVRADRLIAYVIDDAHTATNLYEAGGIDWLPYPSVPPDYLRYMRGRFRDLMTFSQIGLMYCGLNISRPPLDNVLVRRALSLAIDRRAITEGLLRGGEVPTDHFVPSGFPGYPPPPEPLYDPVQAARLLAQAGFPEGRNFPVFEILIPPDRRAVAEALQQHWAKNLHIQVTIHSEEFSSWLKRWDAIDYDIALTRWIGDYFDPSTFTDLMLTDGGNNNTHWGSREYDDALAQAAIETNPEKRMKLLQHAEQVLLAESPVIPLYILAANELVKPYVRGWHAAPWDVLPLNRIFIDTTWRPGSAERESQMSASKGARP